MSNTPPYAVIGATGQQGGAVADALLARGLPVRGLVRDAGSASSRALEERGVGLVTADLDDPDSLTAAMRGTAALFAMTTYSGPEGTEGEVAHGRAIADAAARAGVPHVVYSSVGGAERRSGVPHFESKRRIEEHLESAVSASFVRPTFFMDNFARALSRDAGEEIVIRLPMPGDVLLQMIAVRDIGIVAAAAMVDPSVLGGRAVEIAGDELTGDRIAERIGAATGRPARFEAAPLEVLGEDEDRKAMFRWFVDTPAYEADLASTRAIDPDVLNLTGWARARTRS